MTKRRAVLLGLILLIFGAIWAKNARWVEIDTCRDGGGRWDSETSKCQH